MALQYTYNPDGSIKSVVSVNPDGTRKVGTDDTPLPVLGYSIPNTALKKINAKEEMFGSLRSMLKNPGVLTKLDRQMIADQMQEIRDFNNQKFDPITGQSGKRNIEDFKKFIRINKEGFLRDEGQFEGFRGGGMKSFNEFLNDLQEGKIDQLSPEEAKFIDDLKNNRVN